MKRLPVAGIAAILFLLIIFPSTADVKNIDEVTVVVPEDSIAQFIKPLLPYRIDFGENFSGSFWIKSIENIKIKNDRIFFSTHIYGKDIKYSAKISNQKVSLLLGSVNLQNNWEASLKYDKNNKKLLIKPHVEDPGNKKDLSQGDILVNALLIALSDIEYPIDVSNLKPITSDLNNQVLTINMVISDVYAENSKLFLKIIPTARIDD